MKHQFITDGTTKYIAFDYGDVVVLYDRAGDVRPEDAAEVWFDHKGNGSGTNNLVVDGFGRQLDLEFCSSRPLSDNERAIVRETPA